MVLKAKSTRRDKDIKTKVLEDVSAEPLKRLNTEIPSGLHKEGSWQNVGWNRTNGCKVSQTRESINNDAETTVSVHI